MTLIISIFELPLLIFSDYAETSDPMNITHIEHIGIAVKDLDAAIAYYEKVLGLTCYHVEEVADQQVKTAFFQVGQTKVELLESTSPEGTIAKFIDKRGEGLHHLAFAVDSVQSALDEAAEQDLRLIDHKPRPGAEGLNIAFLHPKSTFGTLTELCEKPRSEGGAHTGESDQ
jgi:methylmalonyl-CoA/ethylmalonyl-CoA epimerase